MNKKTDNGEYHSGMLGDLSIPDLKDKVIRLWREIQLMKAEKKDYVKSVSDTIKELKSQIDSAVHWIDTKQTEQDKQAIANKVSETLSE